MPENRRVKMTKRLIKEACVELLAKNPEKKVSVTEICELADVNRSTFYTHYDDFDALLAEIESEVLEQVPVLVADSDPDHLEKNKILLQHFFEFFLNNPNLFILFGSGERSRVWEEMLAGTLFRDILPDLEAERSHETFYRHVFCVIGVLGAVREWLFSKRPIPTNVMADLMLGCCYRALDDAAPFSINY